MSEYKRLLKKVSAWKLQRCNEKVKTILGKVNRDTNFIIQ